MQGNNDHLNGYHRPKDHFLPISKRVPFSVYSLEVIALLERERLGALTQFFETTICMTTMFNRWLFPQHQ